MIQRNYLALVLFIFIAKLLPVSGSEIPLPYYTEPTFTPQWFEQKPDALHRIPEFSFSDQTGAKITQDQLTGKIYVANFFFTACPGICPKMANNLLEIQEIFVREDKVKILSHSVAPSVDTVEQLKAYADRNQINHSKWHLLTGPQTSIYNLARKFYFADKVTGYNKGTDEFLHTENFVLIDAAGHIRGVYNGVRSLDMQRLTKDIRTLLKETQTGNS